MRIICPKCQFVREVPDDKIPASAQTATCPKCKLRFNFRTSQPVEPAVPGEPAAPPPPPSPETKRPRDEGEVEIGGVRRPIGKPWPIEPGKAPPEVEDLYVPPPEDDKTGKAPEEPPGDIWQRLESLGEAEERRSRRLASDSYRQQAQPAAEVPWEEAEKLGFPQAAWLTIKQVLTAPRLFFGTMPVRPIGRSLIYALCFFVFNSIANVMSIHFAVSDPEVLSFLAANPDFQETIRQLLTPGGTILLFGLTYLFSAASFLLSSAVTQLFLKLFGAGRSGLGQTMRVNAYAQTPTIFYLIPYVGHYLGSFWYLALFIIGLKSIHKTTGPKVVLSLLAPLPILLGIVLTLSLWGAVKA